MFMGSFCSLSVMVASIYTLKPIIKVKVMTQGQGQVTNGDLT